MKTLRLGLMFWAAAALAQFPYPGGGPFPGGVPFPGGGYPGGQYPQQTQQPRQDSRASNRGTFSTTDGMVRRNSGNQLVIQADDHRIVWFRITAQTEANKNGDKVDAGSFPMGDHVSVEATEDDNGFLTATSVEWTREGSPQERAAAKETWDLPGPEAGSAAATGSERRSSDNVDDPDRPILRRNNSEDASATPPAANPSSTAAPAPQAPPAQSASPVPPAQSASAAPRDDSPARPATENTPPAAPPDADDPGRPVLRRGGSAVAHVPDPGNTSPPGTAPAPARNASAGNPASGNGPANGSPALIGAGGASQSAATTRPAQPILPQEDPLISKAREAAFNFTNSLPNFFCQQMTTRYHTQNIRQGWDAADIVTADVAYENGQERYKNIKIGNRPTNKPMDQIGGATSTGEFSTLLEDLMSQSTGAVFRRDVADTIRGRSAIVFKLDVPRERSHWRVEAPSQIYYPAYRGSVWVDKATGRVLRLEIQARNIPTAFPFDTVEAATDYDFIRLAAGEQEYLLPSNAEVLSCDRGTSYCSRNRIEFRNYRKFDAASSISFN